MWIRYWMLILLAVLIAVVSYLVNHPTLGWKVAALCDAIRSESVSLIDEVWGIIARLLP